MFHMSVKIILIVACVLANGCNDSSHSDYRDTSDPSSTTRATWKQQNCFIQAGIPQNSPDYRISETEYDSVLRCMSTGNKHTTRVVIEPINRGLSILQELKQSTSRYSVVLGQFTDEMLCKAATNAMVGTSPSIMLAKEELSIIRISFNRESDGKYWTYYCRRSENWMYWGSSILDMNKLETKLLIRTDGNTLFLRVIETDGSSSTKTYALNDLQDTLLRKTLANTKERQSSSNRAPLPVQEDVRVIQSLLTDIGYEPGPADGKLGSMTVSAIRLFQSESGVRVDGVVSKELERSLIATKSILDNDTPSDNSTKPTKQESNIDLIVNLQFFLAVSGLYTGEKNGLMNDELEYAIERFQVEHRLSADGQPSQNLLTAVKQALKE